MNVLDVLTVTFVFLGAFFGMVAGIGIVRMPDLYMRMQSATKAGTLGIACIAAAVATHFQSAGITVQAVLVILFLFATAPIASHLIARAAAVAGVKFWWSTSLPAEWQAKSDSDSAPRP
ncbi:MAG: monovalent cation/H(+) antiporter subunit G [Planctomycetota bacterium]